MTNSYDIIIIGGGHNGLTAACTLARKGKKVLVLEKRPILGGVAAGEEFHPGYRTNGLLHDTSNVRPSVLQSLQLDKYGLKTVGVRPPVMLLSKEGQAITISSNIDETINEISKVSKKDAAAWPEYRAFIDKIGGFVNGLMNDAPPQLLNPGLKQLLVLAKKGLALRRLGKKTMLEFLKIAPMSVADFLDERFETGFLKAGISGPSVYSSYTSPRSAFTTLNLLLWECAATESIPGGPQALVSALEAAAKDAGVEIITDAPVEKILLNSNGRAEGVRLNNGNEIKAQVIVASCTPKETFLNLLSPNEIDYTLEHAVQKIRSRGTTAKINLALNKGINFKANTGSEAAFIRTGNSFMEMEKAFDPVKYRKFSEEPLLDIHIPTIENPELAPDGHHVVSVMVHYAPHHFDAGWTSGQKEKLGEAVIKTLVHYTNGLTDAIVAREVLSPIDLEQRYSLTEGHLFHGEHAVDQLITRPIPSCAHYDTPISGLYLCGGGSHPGGGITCMPGALAANRILKDL